MELEKYEMIQKMLDSKLEKISKNGLIAYGEKPYVMYLAIKKMERNYKSEDDSLLFHEALCNWMCRNVFLSK